jgi:hypothetical protein
MADAVREGFAAVRALGVPVTPFALRLLFSWLPRTFATRYWCRYFASEMSDYVFARQGRIAFEEVRRLADDCRILLDQSQVEAPALQQIYAAIAATTDNSLRRMPHRFCDILRWDVRTRLAHQLRVFDARECIFDPRAEGWAVHDPSSGLRL